MYPSPYVVHTSFLGLNKPYREFSSVTLFYDFARYITIVISLRFSLFLLTIL